MNGEDFEFGRLKLDCFVKPKIHLFIFKHGPIDQIIKSAIRFLSALEAIPWRYIAVSHVVSLGEMFAFADVLRRLADD